MTVEPQTGYVRAIVGGYDFFRSEFNRAVQASRQPGSAFKPFVYIAALESGFTAATRVDDAPVSYAVGPNGKAWKPENYDRKFRGPTTLQQALEESVNVVTVKLQERVGVNRTIQVARRFGISSAARPQPEPGARHVRPDPARADVGLRRPRQPGQWLPPTTIRYVTDAAGQAPRGARAARRARRVSPETAYVVTHMLRGVVERGTGQAAKALGRPIAAKTGTTNDYSNAWFIGYTPRLATGVWVGYDRPRSLGKDETGSRVAVPIWVGYMGRVLGDSPKEDFPVPERVVLAPGRPRSVERVRAGRHDGVREGHRAGDGVRRPAADRAGGARRPAPTTPALPAPPLPAPPIPGKPQAAEPGPHRRRVTGARTAASSTLPTRRRRHPGDAPTHHARSRARAPEGSALRARVGRRHLRPRGPASSSRSKTRSSSAIGTRICSIESRSRIVTRRSPASPFSASPTVFTSTVTQYGVPTSSCRR